MEQLVNYVASTLTAAVNATATTIPVSNASLLLATGTWRALVDSEIMIVQSVTGGTGVATVTRGAESTTAATHAAGAAFIPIITAGGLAALGLPVQATPLVGNNADITFAAVIQGQSGGFQSLTANRNANLPATPLPGQAVTVVDLDGSILSWNFVVQGNGNNVQGATTYTMGSSLGRYASLSFQFFNSTIGWRLV